MAGFNDISNWEVLYIADVGKVNAVTVLVHNVRQPAVKQLDLIVPTVCPFS